MTLVCQDWGGLIGLRLVAENPDRFDRVVAANTFLPTGDAPAGEAFLAWQGVLAGRRRTSTSAASSRAAAHAAVRTRSSRPTTRRSPTTRTRRARASSRRSCRSRPTIRPRRPTARRGRCSRSGRSRSSPRSATRTRSPAAAIARSRRVCPGTKGQPHTTIEGGGHFLQEDKGEELARVIVDWFART